MAIYKPGMLRENVKSRKLTPSNQHTVEAAKKSTPLIFSPLSVTNRRRIHWHGTIAKARRKHAQPPSCQER